MFQDGEHLAVPQGLVDATAEHRVGAWMTSNGIRAVHAGLWDSSGTWREKRLGPTAAARALEHGWSFIEAIQWWDAGDGTWGAVPPIGATPNAGAGVPPGPQQQPVRLDPGTARPHPFDEGTLLIAGDFTGPLAELSPRLQLQRMVDRAAAVGIEVRVAWEFEYIVLDQSAETLAADGAPSVTAAMAANRCWSGLTPATEAEYLGDLVDTLERGGIIVDHTCSELGPGCIELAVGPAPAVESADQAALARLWTRAFHARRGQTASFMPQLAEGFPGLGGHPSLSLWSTDDGRPLLTNDDGTLTGLGNSAVAGIVSLVPETMVLAASTVNAYRRYAPGNWAPRTATWGPGNYSCGLRVVDGDPDGARLELRLPGADTPTHACLAMVLGAALWGIEAALEPPPPVLSPIDARNDPGAGPLPRSLLESGERFAASTTAVKLFGPEWVAHVSGAAAAEDAACRRMVSAGERLRYLL